MTFIKLSLACIVALVNVQIYGMQKLNKTIMGKMIPYSRFYSTNYHTLLDLHKGASKEEIKKAYRKKAK